MKNKIKKINIYYVFDVLLALAVVLFLLSSKSKGFIYGSVISFIIIGVLIILELNEKTQLTPTIVTNNSDMKLLVKYENDTIPREIDPNTSVEGVDGIRFHNGKVYKACNGTHVVIDKQGNITTKSLSGKVANTIRGGFISSKPDESWNLLFEGCNPQ